MTDDLLSMNIEELAPLIRQHKVSPVELTTAVLDRAESVGKTLGSIISLLKEQAMAQAKAREADIMRGGYRGPLDGVPVSIKDNIATAGIRTTIGSMAYDQNVPEEDAHVVTQLRNAGAIIFSKDNLHELAGGITTDNPFYGKARNPWNLECNPGGSSGGTAANVSGRVSFAGLGTDLGGLVRGPAALCGVYGLKASHGRVSTRGLLGSALVSDNIGPLARSPRDTAYMLQAVAGYDMLDPNSVPVPVPDYTASMGRPLTGLRAGIPTNFYFDDVTDEVEANFWTAAENLQHAGLETKRIELPSLKYAEIMRAVGGAETVVTLENVLREQRENITEAARIRYLAGQFVLARDYVKASRVQHIIREEFLRAFQEVDFILAPSRNVPPTPPGTTVNVGGKEYDPSKPGLVIGHNFFPCNSTGLPSLAAPSGFTKHNLPTGILLIGRPFEEGLLFQVAQAHDEARPGRDNVPEVLTKAAATA